MTVKTRPWDAANYIRDAEDAAAYLDATITESGHDVAAIAQALGAIARARGMTDLAMKTGLGRASLYKTLSAGGNPSFETILKITEALGLKLHVAPAAGPRR